MNLKNPGLALPALVKISSPLVFLNEVKGELKKVEWPSRGKTIRLTVIVVAASAIVGIYIGALDWLFTLMLTFLVK